MLQIKFDQDWPTGLRDIHVSNCKYIRMFLGLKGISEVTIRPEFKLVRDFMPVLASFEKPGMIFPLYVYGKLFRRSRAPNYEWMVRFGRNSKASEIVCLSSLPASLMKIGSKLKAFTWIHRLPHYKTMRAFCCHGNHSFGGIFSKPKGSLYPITLMIHTLGKSSNRSPRTFKILAKVSKLV